MTARIVTTTYSYKRPPKRKGRKLAEIPGPAVITAKGSRRPVLDETAAEVDARPPQLRLMRREAAAQSTTAAPP